MDGKRRPGASVSAVWPHLTASQRPMARSSCQEPPDSGSWTQGGECCSVQHAMEERDEAFHAAFGAETAL